jgi:hypothetical protein
MTRRRVAHIMLMPEPYFYDFLCHIITAVNINDHFNATLFCSPCSDLEVLYVAEGIVKYM